MSHFHSLADFIHMGGYAPYVWTSYGLVMALLFANLIQPMMKQKKLFRQLLTKIRERDESST